MVDYEKVVFEALSKTGTSLNTLISNRINVDKVEAFNPASQKGIMFRVRNGLSHVYNPFHSITIDFFCYGGADNWSASQEVYRALHDLLHGQTMIETTSGMIMSAWVSSIGQNIFETDTQYYLTIGSFDLTVRAKS